MAFPETIIHEEVKIPESIDWQPVLEDRSRKEQTLENFKLYDFVFETPNVFNLGKYTFTFPENTHLTVFDFSKEEDKFLFRLEFLDEAEPPITFEIVNGQYDIQDRARRFFKENDVISS